MGLTVNKDGNGSGERVLPKTGARPARLVQVVELGRKDATWKGEVTGEFDFVRLTFDLVDDLHTFDESKGPQPLRVNPFPIKVVGGDRSNLTKVINALDPSGELGDSPDLEDMLGMPCILTIHHKAGKKGTYANIQSYSPAPDIDGFVISDTPSELSYFNFYAPTKEAWDKLPEFIQKDISESKNFNKEVFDNLDSEDEKPY